MAQVAKFTAMIKSIAVKQPGGGPGRGHDEQGDDSRKSRQAKQPVRVDPFHELNRSSLS